MDTMKLIKKLGVKAVVAGLSMAAVVGFASEAAAEEKTHDGFYMQIYAGPGYYSASAESGGIESSFSGVTFASAILLVSVLAPPTPAAAVTPPEDDSPLRQKIYRHEDLYVRQGGKAINELPAALAAKAAADLTALGGQTGYVDPRSGRFSLVVASRPLVSAAGLHEAAAKSAVLSYLAQFQAQLGVRFTF